MKIKIDKDTAKKIVKALTPIVIDIIFTIVTKGKPLKK